MTSSEIQGRVSRILKDRMNLTVPGPDSDLLAAGQLDSLAIIDLLVHLEETFGVVVDLGTIEIEDLRSVARISGLVARRLEAA